MCVTGKNKVAGFDSAVAGKAGLEKGLVGKFAVVEMGVAPAARRHVLSRVLDHELNAVLGVPRHERLAWNWPTSEIGKRFVVFLRRVVAPGNSGDGGAFRKR